MIRPLLLLAGLALVASACNGRDGASASETAAGAMADTAAPAEPMPVYPDSAALAERAALASDSAIHLAVSTRLRQRGTNDSISKVHAIRDGLRNPGWPVRAPAPLPNSILPDNRIIAFYGNPLSRRMGILGEIEPDQMLARLDQVVAQWREADPGRGVQPALHLVTIVAQNTPGRDSMYRYRIHPDIIERVYGWAQQRNAILFLDIQTGLSTVKAELDHLLPYLERPDVHLGMDPEFHMHYQRAGVAPGRRIGTMTAREVNHAIETLAELVSRHNLPPKVLVIHRFTQMMLQNASDIKLDPRVQVVIHMDGFGQPWLKYDTYRMFVVSEPVQYTGFKLFFKNDTRHGDPLLTPREILSLRPQPLYIQYQ